MTIVKSHATSNQGQRRKNNEDAIAFFEPSDPAELRNCGCLYIVADGVGGAARGERASQYAAERAVYEYYQSAEGEVSYLPEPLGDLSAILQRVNEEINDFASARGTRMATTIVAAVVRGEYLYLANVGDSRAYLIRNSVATQLTRDHSLVGEMVRQGEMTEAEAMASNIKNRLTRSLGGDPEVTVDTYGPLKLENGDKIILCSDGLTRYATIEDITAMSVLGAPREIAERMVKFANNHGGADNISVIAISYQPLVVDDSVVPIAPRPPHIANLSEYEQEEKTQPGKKDIPFWENKKMISYVAMAMTFFVIAFALAGVSYIFSKPKPTPTAIPNLPIMISPSAVPVTATLTSAPSETAIILPTEITPIILSMQTPQETQVPVQGLCTARVSNEDSMGLGEILQKFGLIYDGQQKYQSCEGAECVHQTLILDHDAIQPGLIVIIPDVSKPTCDTGGGKWIMLTPASSP